MNLRIIVVILLLIGYSELVAQVEEARQALANYQQELADCLESEGQGCATLQAKVISTLGSLNTDTTAARLAIEFARIREKAGYWDEETEALLTLAHQRNVAAKLPCEQVETQFLLTRFALFTSESEETLNRANKGLALAEACGEKQHIPHAYAYLGAAYIELGNYRTALEKLIQAEQGYTEIGDEKGLAIVKLDMAVAYTDLEDQEKARTLTKEAALIYQRLGEELSYAIALIDLCSSFLDADLTDSAEHYLPVGEALVDGRHPLAMAYVQQHYGNLYLKQGKYQRAIAALEKATALNATIGDEGLQINTNNFLADVYTAQKNYQEAYHYARENANTSRELGVNNLRLKTLKTLAKTAYTVGAYDESYQAFTEYLHWYDSLLGVEKQKEIAALEQAFAAEKREAEIARQQEANKLLSEKNKALNTRNLALLGALVLLGVAAYTFLNRQRLRTEQQRTLVKLKAAENDRLQLAVEFKNRELTAQALHIAQKNEMLNDLKADIDQLQRNEKLGDSLHKLSSKLRFESQINDSWKQFTRQFTEMNPVFYQTLGQKHAGLTQSDLRLASLLRMNLDSKEIAHTLNISDEAVKKARYRLRKKLALETSDKLEAYIMSI